MTTDWKEVEGTSGKIVYFTVYDCDGGTEDISGHTVTLKVWQDDGTTLKFSGGCNLVGGGLLGRCSYTLGATDIAIGDKRVYLFGLELDDGAGIVRVTEKGSLRILRGPPV